MLALFGLFVLDILLFLRGVFIPAIAIFVFLLLALWSWLFSETKFKYKWFERLLSTALSLLWGVFFCAIAFLLTTEGFEIVAVISALFGLIIIVTSIITVLTHAVKSVLPNKDKIFVNDQKVIPFGTIVTTPNGGEYIFENNKWKSLGTGEVVTASKSIKYLADLVITQF